MFQACSELVNFLDQNGMYKSSKALKDEMEIQLRNGLGNQQGPPDKNLMKLIKNALNEKQKIEQQKMANKNQQNQQKYNQPNQPQLLSQEETETIMEKLMNKLVASPNLLEDEKLNAKIEKFFDNSTFQKMVEGTDVFQDISNLSFTNSFMQKNKQDQQNKTQTDNSWELAQAPKFGNQNNDQLIQNNDIEQNNNYLPQQNFNNQQQQQQNQFVTPKHDNKPNETDELFTENNEQQNVEANELNLKGAGIDYKGNMVQIENQQNQEQQIMPIKISQNEHNRNIDQNKDMPSMIRPDNPDQSSNLISESDFSQLGDLNQDVEEYEGDDDPGFDLYEVDEREFGRVSKQLAEKYKFPERAVHYGKKKINKVPEEQKAQRQARGVKQEDDSAIILQDIQQQQSEKKKDNEANDGNQVTEEKDKQQQVLNENGQLVVGGEEDKKKSKGYIFLPDNLKHPSTEDNFYPVEYDKVIYDCFNLKVIYDRERTGFEETKEFPIVINSIIAGRYQIMEYLGSAAFSKAIQCLDLVTNQMLCMKIIENNKDYFDQSVDEIKLLKYINVNGEVDDKNVLRMYDYFYHKEHLFIVTELLKDNLYEFYKFNKEQESIPYFTLGRLQRITKQILIGLEYIHGLHLIHCDLKPENILMKSYSKVQVKVIDFGSSCFIHDHLSSYVQSRSYRAPEVIIGCKYDFKIDMWSLGCILAELWTGNVLFQNESVQGLLSRVMGIIGPFPDWMFKEGRLVHNFFTNEKLLYQEVFEDGEYSQNFNETSDMGGQRKRNKTGRIQILVPKKTNLRYRLKTDDVLFIDFVKQLLRIDYTKRPSATEALNHPWLTQQKYQDGL